MQKNYMVKKIKLYFDGATEYSGLAEVSALKDVDVLVDVPTFNRIFQVKANVSKLDPITVKFLINRGSNVPAFLRSWKDNNEYHDIVAEKTDATGATVEKTSLRDCECHSIEESPYNAATPEVFAMTAIFNCTTIPIIREA